MSLIVVEGVDASGKSTLLDNLRTVKGYFVLVRHSCRPLASWDVQDFLTWIESQSHMTKVLDRHPLISEPIYGPILRKHNLIDLIEKDDGRIVARLKRTVNLIIYCRPPTELILHNLHNREQLKGIEENILKLIEAYDYRMHILRQEGISVVNYDYQVPTDFHSLLNGGL